MYTVYILYSTKDRRLYVGCTRNLGERLRKHNSGRVISTRNRRPLELIHSENFPEKKDAFKRERFMKSLWSGRFKKKLIEKYLKSVQG